MFLGVAVGETMKRQESMKQIKDSLPRWCDPQQAQAVANLKVHMRKCMQTVANVQ